MHAMFVLCVQSSYLGAACTGYRVFLYIYSDYVKKSRKIQQAAIAIHLFYVMHCNQIKCT